MFAITYSSRGQCERMGRSFRSPTSHGSVHHLSPPTSSRCILSVPRNSDDCLCPCLFHLVTAHFTDFLTCLAFPSVCFTLKRPSYCSLHTLQQAVRMWLQQLHIVPESCLASDIRAVPRPGSTTCDSSLFVSLSLFCSILPTMTTAQRHCLEQSTYCLYGCCNGY